jgi:hypothetical protein
VHYPTLRGVMLTRSLACVFAAGALLAGCSDPGVTLTPQHVVPTPTPTPVGATPTPTPVGATPTPTPTPVGATPTPTPTPTPVGATPTPTPVGATPTPTPTPTATPTAPAGMFTFDPNPVIVSAQGSGCSTSTSFSVAETGYSGTFTAVSANTSIATVAPTSGVADDFTVTSVTTTNGGTGTTIVVTDANGHHASETVVIGTCI